MRLPGSILQGILARAALTLLRIYLGVSLLVGAGLNLEGGHVAEQVLLPRMSAVAALILWLELVVGFFLVLGLMTRLVAALAFLLSLNFMLAQGSGFWSPANAYPAWAVMSLVILIGAAGRTFGLDAFLAQRWPRSPLW
jgi:uncharacterized membrane protein YphA (DoxX/SURF4 family)